MDGQFPLNYQKCRFSTNKAQYRAHENFSQLPHEYKYLSSKYTHPATPFLQSKI